MSKKINSTIVTALWVALLIASLGFGGYKLLTSDIFDTTGGYVKAIADNNDIDYFMQTCTSINYDTMMLNYTNYTGKPIKYLVKIVDETTSFGGSVEYIVNVTMDDDTVRLVEVKPLFQDTFYKGDSVIMYGTLKGVVKYNNAGNIPYIEARKFVDAE